MPSEFHGTVQEYSQLPVRARLMQWKWWFVVALLIAIAFGVYVISQSVESVGADPDSEQISSTSGGALLGYLLAAPVAAQDDTDEGDQDPGQPQPYRAYVMLGTFILLGVVTLVALGVSLFSRNEKAVTAASDILKTCIGFFIGAGTSYVG